MRNNIISSAAVAASAILLTLSCTKQEEMQSVNKGKTFIATIEQAQTKTTLEDNGDGKYFVNWNSGDLININAQAVYSAEPDSRKAGYAEFTFVKGQEPEAPYRAVYPADLYNSEDKSLYFPMVQQYEAGRCNAPMMAVGDEESLLFHNICGVICFSLTGTDKVRAIEIFSESRRLWGRFSVDPDTWTAKVDEDESQIIGGMGMGMVNPNSVALDCGEDGVQLNMEKATDFYLYLPANSYPENDLRVNITGTEGGEFSMTAQNAVTVERNCVYPFAWTVEFGHSAPVDTLIVIPTPTPVAAPDGVLSSHVFTVGAGPADKVYFSKGNLRALYNNSELSWSFAGNQYEFIGNNSGNAGLINGEALQNEDIIDLFCWSVEGNDYGVYDPGYDNSFKDWGSAIDGEVWRTLSGKEGGEWEYLLEKRVVNGGYGYGYAYEGINNEVIAGQLVTGVAIFPDEFTAQAAWKEEFTNWDDIANAGIVFLPMAGWGYCVGYSLQFWDSLVYYWSRSDAHGFLYDPDDESPFNPTAYVGSTSARCAVRLVSNAFVLAPPAPPATDVVVVESVDGEQ